MGGHGGLNILPQKSWNVYNRDNKLKVARDEAEHEAKQAEVRERAEAADRERRRQLLLQRARQRYGDQHGAEGGAVQGQAAAPALEGPPADAQRADWQADAAAMRGLAAGQADHFAALEAQVQQEAPAAARRSGDGQARVSRKRERRQQQQQGPPPTLAQLASQLNAPGGGAALQQQEREQGAVAAAQQQQQQERQGKLQRFNLFAEEEEAAAAARRKNPEAEAERREEQRRRGDAKTQTSDARFDEQFRFANRLYGQAAVPWYAKSGSTLPAAQEEAGPGGQDQLRLEQAQQAAGGRKQMWQWEMQARAALAGVPQQAQLAQPAQQQAPALLAGVKVVQPGGKDAGGGGQKGESSSSSSSSSDSSSSSSSSSDSDSSSDDDRKRRRHRSSKRRRRDGSSGRTKERRSKERRKGRKSGSRRSKGGGGTGGKDIAQLRLERLQREDAERSRQQAVLAAAQGRDPALAGKRYHQSFGFVRR